MSKADEIDDNRQQMLFHLRIFFPSTPGALRRHGSLPRGIFFSFPRFALIYFSGNLQGRHVNGFGYFPLFKLDKCSRRDKKTLVCRELIFFMTTRLIRRSFISRLLSSRVNKAEQMCSCETNYITRA